MLARYFWFCVLQKKLSVSLYGQHEVNEVTVTDWYDYLPKSVCPSNLSFC